MQRNMGIVHMVFYSPRFPSRQVQQFKNKDCITRSKLENSRGKELKI